MAVPAACRWHTCRRPGWVGEFYHKGEKKVQSRDLGSLLSLSAFGNALGHTCFLRLTLENHVLMDLLVRYQKGKGAFLRLSMGAGLSLKHKGHFCCQSSWGEAALEAGSED